MCRRTAMERLAVVLIAAVLAVYSAESRTQLQEVRATPWSGFGVSVAVESGFLFVAANSERSGKRDPGTVHLFQRRDSAWVHVGVLLVPEATVEDFGVSMAAHGKILVLIIAR